MLLFLLISCQPKHQKTEPNKFDKGTFGYDLEFLTKYQETLLLKNGEAMLAVCPGYQGRVMTSTAGGESGMSYGWLNYDLIKSGEILEHINPVGGEDRFWLGPEGGQFSIFFKKGEDFNLGNWQTPAPIDTEAYDVVFKNDTAVSFEKEFELMNYSEARMSLKVHRSISLLSTQQVQEKLNLELSDKLRFVAYQSLNTITNTGPNTWDRASGALSIWILGMFNPSPEMTIFIPFKQGPVDQLGEKVNDSYFGKVPEERLVVKDDMLFFKGDGQYRSKIGLNPNRALPLMASYDARFKVLTIVHYTKPKDATEYVNSMWELQEAPFAGDAVNSYNDGPVDGKAMGPFYELETSSPAAFLASGQSITHVHTTMHIQGEEEEINIVLNDLFDIDILTVKNIFNEF
jgi:hypothetical protein